MKGTKEETPGPRFEVVRHLPDGTWVECERWDPDLEAALVAWEKAVLWDAYASGGLEGGWEEPSRLQDRWRGEAIDARAEFIHMLWNYHGEYVRRTWLRPGEKRKP